MSSTERFGYEWEVYHQIDALHTYYREQFLNWVWPLTKADFQGRTILDAGCGIGRNSYWCALWGAQEVAAFDYDERTVAAARRNLSRFPAAQVYQHSIYALPWRDHFDIVLSIGVIHHLKHPEQAVAELCTTIKPGGQIVLWVYSSVGFERWLTLLNPLRTLVTSRLPAPLLHFLTYIISGPFYLWLRVGQPRHRYFQQLKGFRFSHVHNILFDQLLPDIAHYYTAEQARALLAGFNRVTVTAPPNGNGWVVRGFKQ
jgi:SAM-dependent methyltransferase